MTNGDGLDIRKKVHRDEIGLCFKKLSNVIVWTLHSLFYKIGYLVALNPIKTIVSCLIVCGGMGAGFIKLHEENNYIKVWMPRGSRMINEYNWVERYFPVAARYESVIVENDNVLTPKALNAMMAIYRKSTTFVTEGGHTLESLCVRSGPECRVNSILEIWSYNETVIKNLTTAEILDRVNTDNLISPLYQSKLSIEAILGGIIREENGTIISAGATTMLWLLETDKSLEEASMDWELQLINFVNDEDHTDLQNVYIYTKRTFDDEGIGTVSKDMWLLTAGFSIVLVYVTITIGNYSMVHHKILLAFCGLLSIGMSIVFTYGFGFVTGIMYGIMGQLLPFMLLGIGVDDMFVIVESYKRLTLQQQRLSVEERIALTLRHAGVSITVTSITDMVAFGIGASTVIPALSTFCIYAAIGVFALYILQATYFVACLTLDQRRVDANSDACIMCYTHSEDYRPNRYYRFSVQDVFFKEIWGSLVTKLPIKIIIITIAIGVTGANIWSVTKLEHDFDYKDYLPSDSYSFKYVDADRKYFPDDGTFVLVYFDYYPNTNKGFYTLLQRYLLSRDGRGYMRYINVKDMKNISSIQASALTFRHTKFESSWEHIDAMEAVRAFLDSFTFKGGGTCFPYNDNQYFWNETNKVLKSELYRNLLIAAICVFFVTLIIIANLWTSILVFLCVVATVIDVAGTLQFSGVAIDTGSSVLLILCFGIAVDYSAHVGHAFMTLIGTNNGMGENCFILPKRTKQTLVVIGPAVFSGGFSTFLAFLLLAKSSSYGFTLFFRTFTCVVGFGLFHGLAVLPVLLSLIGPEPYLTSATESGLIQDTEINYRHGELSLNGLKKSKGAQTNGDRGQRIPSYNGRINEGFNEVVAAFDRSAPREIFFDGSYYEQMSNGTMVRIPYPDYSPILSHKTLSNVIIPPPDYI